jgi:hypothetical protein
MSFGFHVSVRFRVVVLMHFTVTNFMEKLMAAQFLRKFSAFSRSLLSSQEPANFTSAKEAAVTAFLPGVTSLRLPLNSPKAEPFLFSLSHLDHYNQCLFF